MFGEVVPGEEMIFIPGQENLSFVDDVHKYFHNGEELRSVSSLIHKYANEFDPDGTITARCAAKNGITIEQQKSEWKKINEQSIIRGHTFHSALEDYIKTKKAPVGPPKTITEDITQQFSKIKFEGMLFSEVRLFNKEFGIAGTTDVIEVLPDRTINLLDLKSNKALKTYSFGKKMLYPLDNIWDANTFHYEIQLNIYAFMLEEAGWWVRDMTLLYIDPQKNKLREVPMQNRRNDVIRMLEHYKSTKTGN